MHVLASFSILADWVRQIGGQRVRVETLVPPMSDVHSFTLKPAHMLAAAKADLLVFNGLGFEGWVERIATAADAADRLVIASEGIDGISGSAGHDEAGHRHGDAADDPHAWHDPRNARAYVRNIAAALIKADPQGADEYAANLAAYENELTQLHEELTELYASLPSQRRLAIVPHNGFRYLGQAYGIDFRALEPGTAAGASAQTAAELVSLASERGISTAFADATGNARQLTALLAEAGVQRMRVLYSDTLSEGGGPAENYLSLMRFNAQAVVEGLR